MTNRWKLWLGVSALAMASGALPAAPILSPIATEALGVDIANEAWAQESGDESGEEATTDCAATEDGEGEEGGTTKCPDETSSGEEGEGG